MSKYDFDGHKLIYHWDRLCAYLKGEDVFPIYMEVSPSGACSSRCIFCAYDYLAYPDRRLDTEKGVKTLQELGRLGLRSVLFAGEGEPLLHPEIDKLIKAAFTSNIDVGIYSNCHFLKPALSEKILPYLTFIRCSINGGSKNIYSQVHRVKKEMFDKVIENLAYAVNFKNKNNLNVDIGLQIVALPENLNSIPELAQLGKEIGVDYLAIKPFVQHPDQKGYKMKKNFAVEEIDYILKKAEEYANESYTVVARRKSFQKYNQRTYKRCYGLPFFAVIGSDGNVYSCLQYFGDKNFCYGSIYQSSFKEIWESERKKKIFEFVYTKLDARKCMPNCRLDAINRFLWEIKHPTVKHINFI